MLCGGENILANGKNYTGYMTCAPDVQLGDEIKITILTQKFKAEFIRTALVDLSLMSVILFLLRWRITRMT